MAKDKDFMTLAIAARAFDSENNTDGRRPLNALRKRKVLRLTADHGAAVAAFGGFFKETTKPHTVSVEFGYLLIIKAPRSYSMNDRESRLLQLIRDSFRGVELGDGVSAHETIVIDDYGSPEERQAARASDEKRDWRKLIDDPELPRGYGSGGLCFFDAAGLRFHLPAYLMLAVLDSDPNLVETLLFTLTDFSQYNLERLALLDEAQRRCVSEVLGYLRDVFKDDDSNLDRAIQVYWNPGSQL